MDIRERLGQMVRGQTTTFLGRTVAFNKDGEFTVWTVPRGDAPVHATKSLKEVVEYFDMLTSAPIPPKALHVTYDEEHPQHIDTNDIKYRVPELFSAPSSPECPRVVSRPANIPDISLEDPPTQLYGRAQRDVKEALAYEIPTLGTLVEPCTPYGYINTDGLATMCKTIHRYNVNAGWYTDINTGERIERNVPELLMLIVSELGQAVEGYRKDLMDDKLPHRKMIEVELADALIRICDTAEGLGLDLAGAVQEKVLFNVNRADHKIENRLKEGGKKF